MKFDTYVVFLEAGDRAFAEEISGELFNTIENVESRFKEAEIQFNGVQLLHEFQDEWNDYDNSQVEFKNSLESKMISYVHILKKNFDSKLTIFTEQIEGCNDSVFYYGNTIATIEIPNGRTLYLETCGELILNVDGVTYCGEAVSKYLLENKYTDDTLGELYDDDAFSCTNWYRIVELDADLNMISDEITLDGEYDQAMESLREEAKNFGIY